MVARFSDMVHRLEAVSTCALYETRSKPNMGTGQRDSEWHNALAVNLGPVRLPEETELYLAALENNNRKITAQ